MNGLGLSMWQSTIRNEWGTFGAGASLNLDFTSGNQTLDPRITFSRASNATRVNRSGVLELVSNNGPRFDYDPVTLQPKGLLIEEQRTNFVLQSSALGDIVWQKSFASVFSDVLTAPDGTQSADKVVEDSISATEHYARSSAVALTAGTYTTSVYWHESSERSLYLRVVHIGDTSTTSQVVFNKSTLTLGSYSGNAISASAESVSGGWWRVSLTFNITATRSVQSGMQLYANSAVYTGDGTSGIYIWGAQLEAGAFPTSYIPTTTAAATRAADVAVMTGVNFSNWYRQDEGALFVDLVNASRTAASAFPRLLSIVGANANTDEISIYTRTQLGGGGTGRAYPAITAGGTSTFLPDETSLAVDSWKAAIAYKTNDAVFATNGLVGATDTSVTLPVAEALRIGGAVRFQSMPGAVWYRRIAYFPRRLTNAELIGLTS